MSAGTGAQMGGDGGNAPKRFWTPSFTVLMAGALAALTVLVLLGNWQMRRLEWKESLLATIEARRTAEPIGVDELVARPPDDGAVEEIGPFDYRPIEVTGTFGGEEALFYATDKGVVGWQVLAPLALPDGRVLVVNRGFVPDAYRDPAARPDPLPAGEVTLTGLARSPATEKPNRFVPDNTAEIFYWKDLPAIVAALGIDPDATLPLMLDADTMAGAQLPQGGQTIITMPNNHLGYAFTWYGIGAGLVGVVIALVLQRRRQMRGGAPKANARPYA